MRAAPLPRVGAASSGRSRHSPLASRASARLPGTFRGGAAGGRILGRLREPVLGHERLDPAGQRASVVLGRVGAVPVQRAIARHQVRTMPMQPRGVPLLHARAQVQTGVAHVGGARLLDARERAVKVLLGVGEERQDRHHEHGHIEARLGGRRHGREAGRRGGRSRLHRGLELVVKDRDGHGELDVDVLCRLR